MTAEDRCCDSHGLRCLVQENACCEPCAQMLDVADFSASSEEPTAEGSAPVAGLTSEERDSLCDAVVDYTANRAASAPDRFDQYLVPAVERILADRVQRAEVRALREFADTRGINVGSEDDEWWHGYRQAQRECMHDASDRADRIETEETK
jgi:hypothetical protein